MADDPEIKPPESEPPGSDPTKQHNNAPPIIGSELQIPQAIVQEYSSGQGKQDSREWWKLRLEAATLLAIVGYTVIAGYQGCEMRKATTAANIAAQTGKDALIASQRAYVTVNGLQIDYLRVVGWNEPFWHISPILVNSGNTPTRNLRWAATMRDWTGSESEAPYRPEDLAQTTLNPGTLAPHQETTALITGEPIESRYAEAIGKGEMGVRIHGTIIYGYFFSDTLHLTRYCYLVSGLPRTTEQRVFAYHLCGGKSNCADEECEDYHQLPEILSQRAN